jgi:hypothetical protein
MVTQNPTSMMNPTKPKQWKPKPAAEGVPSLFAASASSKPLKIVKKTATPKTTTSSPPKKSVPILFPSVAATSKPVKVMTKSRPVTPPSSKRNDAPKPAVRTPSPVVVIEKPKPVVVDETKYYSPKKPKAVVEWQKPKPKQVVDKSKPQPVLVARPKFYDEKPRPRGSELGPQEGDENKPVRWSQIPLALETFILQRGGEVLDKHITTNVSEVLKVLRNAEEDADSVSSHEDVGEEDTYHHDKMQDKLSHFMSGHSRGSVSSGSSVASDDSEVKNLFRYGKEFDNIDSDSDVTPKK